MRSDKGPSEHHIQISWNLKILRCRVGHSTIFRRSSQPCGTQGHAGSNSMRMCNTQYVIYFATFLFSKSCPKNYSGIFGAGLTTSPHPWLACMVSPNSAISQQMPMKGPQLRCVKDWVRNGPLRHAEKKFLNTSSDRLLEFHII